MIDLGGWACEVNNKEGLKHATIIAWFRMGSRRRTYWDRSVWVLVVRSSGRRVIKGPETRPNLL